MKHFIMLLFSLLLAVACREQEVLAPIVEFEEVDNADNLTQQIESIQLVPLENDGHYFGWSADLLLLDNGFLVVDNIQSTGRGWCFSYHSPWFDDKIDNTTATKFKGYYEF